MTLKKQPNVKRANPPRDFTRTKEFQKDWVRLSHSGRYDMNRLKEAMLLLIDNAAPLSAEWLDHSLTGEWSGHRECHIGGDFLLIYKIVFRPVRSKSFKRNWARAFERVSLAPSLCC